MKKIVLILLLASFIIFISSNLIFCYKISSYKITTSNPILVTVYKFNRDSYCLLINQNSKQSLFYFDKLNQKLYIPNNYSLNFCEYVLFWKKDQIPGVLIEEDSIKTNGYRFLLKNNYYFIKTHPDLKFFIKINKKIFC